MGRLSAGLCWLVLAGAALAGPERPFADVAHWVKIFEDPARQAWQKPGLVVRTLGLRSGQVVADIGAGSGYFSRPLARAVAPLGWVYAVETEPGFFGPLQELANKQGLQNIVARPATPDDPHLEWESVHLIFMCNTLHHIPDRERYYEKLRDALKPEGRLVIVDFFPNREIPVAPPEAERLSPEQVARELDEAGFEVSQNLTLLPYQWLVEGKK